MRIKLYGPLKSVWDSYCNFMNHSVFGVNLSFSAPHPCFDYEPGAGMNDEKNNEQQSEPGRPVTQSNAGTYKECDSQKSKNK